MGYAIEETTPTSGATEYTEDAASAANPAGGQLMARRRDALSVETTTDGDVTALNSTAKGELYVKATDSDGLLTTIVGTLGSTIFGNGILLTAGARAQLAAGMDGSNARILKTDTNGELQVDVLTLPPLPAGVNRIGIVDLDSDAVIGITTPTVGQLIAGTDGTNARAIKTDITGELQVAITRSIPAGLNNIGDVDIASALPAGNNNIGDVDIASALPAGNNNIGDVDIASALPAGTNNIGDVDVLTLPADPLGANADASVTAGNSGSISGKLRQISSDLDAIKTALQIIDDWDDTDKAKVSLYDSSLNGLSSSTSRPASNARGLNVRPIHEFGKDSVVYCFHTGSTVHVNAASTLMFDMFNADASLIVRILSIQHIVNLETGVTGVGFEWQLLRTTAVGTGGTSLTAWLADTNDTALDSDITARTKATGGATASTSLKWYYTHSEETQAGNQLQGGAFSVANVLPAFLENTGKGLVLRQNQGIRINQETASAAGNSAFQVFFTVE